MVESVLGACLCVRSSALPALGLLDEDYFFFFEEIDWCRRVRQMGLAVYYLPRVRARFIMEGTLRIVFADRLASSINVPS